MEHLAQGVRRETRHAQRQKSGGVAALIAASTFLFGIAMFVTVLADYTTGDPTHEESVAFVVDNREAPYVWNLVIFIVFGIPLVPVVLVLRDRLIGLSPALAQAAGAFGLIWAGLVLAASMVSNIAIGPMADLHETAAGAERVWSALNSVQNGLGGGNEIVGGVWVGVICSGTALTATRAVPSTNLWAETGHESRSPAGPPVGVGLPDCAGGEHPQRCTLGIDLFPRLCRDPREHRGAFHADGVEHEEVLSFGHVAGSPLKGDEVLLRLHAATIVRCQDSERSRTPETTARSMTSLSGRP